MTMEQQIKNLMMEAGTYTPAYDQAIHDLCVLRRQRSRAMTEWKKTVGPKESPSVLDPLYAVILKQDREIAAQSDALGLTPKGLQRLRKVSAAPDDAAPMPATGNEAFARILDGIREKTHGSAP